MGDLKLKTQQICEVIVKSKEKMSYVGYDGRGKLISDLFCERLKTGHVFLALERPYILSLHAHRTLAVSLRPLLSRKMLSHSATLP